MEALSKSAPAPCAVKQKSSLEQSSIKQEVADGDSYPNAATCSSTPSSSSSSRKRALNAGAASATTSTSYCAADGMKIDVI